MARSSKGREVSIPDLSWVQELGKDLVPPEGAMTIRQVSEIKNIDYYSAKNILRRELELGKLEKGKFKSPNCGGLSVYYWPKKLAKAQK